LTYEPALIGNIKRYYYERGKEQGARGKEKGARGKG